MKTITSLTTCLAGILVLGGCSLINSLDDVKSQVADGGSGKGGSAGKGGKGGAAEDAGAVDASGSSSGGKGGGGGNGGAPAVEAGVDASSGRDAGGGGAGGGGGGAGPIDSGEQDSGFGPNGPGGIIVAYNKPQGTNPPAPTLVVMDPKSGAVLHSEPIGAVKGIANDGLDDYWYIFVQEGTPAQGVTLHVRKLRDSDGAWKEYATLPGLPLPVSRVSMLHDRLAYLSAPDPTKLDPLTSTLTILDTIDKTAPKVLGGTANATRLLPSGRKQSLIAKPAAGTGGTVDVLYISSTCVPSGDGGADVCPVQLAEYTVGVTTVQAGTTKVAGHVLTSGVARIDRDPKRDAVVLALPASPAVSSIGCTTFAGAQYQGSVQKFATLDFSSVGQPLVDYPMDSESITGAVYDSCLDTMYVASQNFDRAVYAVPLSDPSAAPAKACRGNGIASLVFEPYTRVLILGQPGGGIPEFLGLGGSALAPAFTSVSLPKIPATFSPVVIGVRQPSGYTQICP